MTFDTSNEVDSSPSSALIPTFLRKRKMNWWSWVLMLLLLGGGSYIVYRFAVIVPAQQANSRILTSPVRRQSLTVTVTANGIVKPERSINVSPKNSGVLKRLLVQEGDTVKSGQIIAYMDDSNLQGQLLQAQGQLAQAQANLDKLIAGNRSQEIAQAEAQLAETQANLQKLQAGNRSQEIAQAQARLTAAQASLNQAEDDLRRNQQLYQVGAIALQTLNQQRAARDSAQAQANEAQAALALQKAGSRVEDIDQAKAQVKRQQQAVDLLKAGTRREDIETARAQVMSARGSLQNIQSQIEDTILRAPFDGLVLKKYADPGAFVTPTTTASDVSSASSSSVLALATANEVVANLSELNIAKINLRQKVTIRADAHPGKTFEGKVSQIAAQATVVQNVTSFEVKVALVSDQQNLLRSGMNVVTEFQVDQVKNAMVVPTAAVVRQQRATGVFVMGADNKPVFTPIETGVTAGNQTEVRSGLTGNEKVLLTFPPGARPESTPRRGILPGMSGGGGGGSRGGSRRQ